jgi:hypothetical protein
VKQALDGLQTPQGLDGLEGKALSKLFAFNGLFNTLKAQVSRFNAEDAFLRALLNLGGKCDTDQLHAEICRLKGSNDVSFDQVGVHARRFVNWCRESGAYQYDNKLKSHKFNASQLANWLVAQVTKPVDVPVKKTASK